LIEQNEFGRMNTKAHVPTSTILQELVDNAPADQVTLEWLLDRLHKRSFGVVMLLLALIATIPGISGFVGLVLAVPALQMIVGRVRPVFPRRIGTRPLPTRHFVRVLQRAVPVLKRLEKAIHPRWQTPFEPTKRIVGIIVLLLCALLLVPVPMSQVLIALVIGLIALAYLEEDGVLLALALLAAIALMMITLALIWGTVWTLSG
jgi:hypothetical protein